MFIEIQETPTNLISINIDRIFMVTKHAGHENMTRVYADPNNYWVAYENYASLMAKILYRLQERDVAMLPRSAPIRDNSRGMSV